MIPIGFDASNGVRIPLSTRAEIGKKSVVKILKSKSANPQDFSTQETHVGTRQNPLRFGSRVRNGTLLDCVDVPEPFEHSLKTLFRA